MDTMQTKIMYALLRYLPRPVVVWLVIAVKVTFYTAVATLHLIAALRIANEVISPLPMLFIVAAALVLLVAFEFVAVVTMYCFYLLGEEAVKNLYNSADSIVPKRKDKDTQ